MTPISHCSILNKNVNNKLESCFYYMIIISIISFMVNQLISPVLNLRQTLCNIYDIYFSTFRWDRGLLHYLPICAPSTVLPGGSCTVP